MSELSRSPERGSFQKSQTDELDIFEHLRIIQEEYEQSPEWQKDNMEYDLLTTDWILDKVRSDEIYAQNLYAAMCNNDFQKLELFNILSGKTWGCSWRHSGGIIADMRQSGDYMDWYCSGIGGLTSYDPDEGRKPGHVSESMVTDEVKSDLERLGWRVIPYDNRESK
jgi:hypothetical protein